MFYSETLLSKTGPLARVWLSANLERKLNKTHILQSDIESSVHAIVDQGQAPLALRLSGQLLLGVVRIYSRKARYLMDDCNEALLKIKMAFRPGNELDFNGPVNSGMPNAALTVPDELAGDIHFPTLDESLFGGADLLGLDLGAPAANNTTADPLNWTSQLPSDRARAGAPLAAPPEEPQPELYENDLDLDLGFGDAPADEGPSIELGRAAPAPERALRAEMADETPQLFDNDLGLTFDDEPLAAPELPTDLEADVPLADRMNLDFDETNLPNGGPPGGGFLNDPTVVEPRVLASPLSSARSSVIREMEAQHAPPPATARARQPAAKRRKLLPIDAETMLPAATIRAQQTDHGAIVKPATFLPRDPLLLALLQMQQSGSLVANVMAGGNLRGMAPQLRGLLSIEAVRRAGAGPLKRKRDSGVADVGEDAEAAPDAAGAAAAAANDDSGLQDEGVADLSRGDADKALEVPADVSLPPLDDDAPPLLGDDDDQQPPTPGDGPPAAFDDTTAPLLHPDEQGPISVGTQHAVHVLRARFGGSASEAASSPARKQHVLFQDLYPPAATRRAEATQMFFETLVLATKDAIKVEQAAGKALGAPIRIRPKRSLWGSWAEREAGGEIAAAEAGAGELREAPVVEAAA